MQVEVRRAVPADSRAIAAIHVRAWQVAYRGLVPDDLVAGLSAERREVFWREAAAGGDGTHPVFVAVGNDALLGFCATAVPSRDQDTGEDVAEIAAIYVSPDVWGSGVGTGLMDAALSEVRARGCHSVTLWVLADNRLARDFYARFGFAPEGAETIHEASGQTEVRLRASLTA
jgi:GNAT superfamily N-acetyltransferase